MQYIILNELAINHFVQRYYRNMQL